MAKNIKTIKKEKHTKRWLVENLIREGTVNILVGEQSRGKSMFVTGMIKEMLKTTRGQEFLGYGVRPCKVLYITTEMEEQKIIDRLANVGVDGRMRNVNKNLFIYYNPALTISDIDRELKEFDADLIIIDILGGLVSGEGFEINSYDAFNTVVPRLRKFGKTFILIHHMNKGKKSLGSIATLSAMDTRMEMLETDRDTDEDYNVIIYQQIHIYGKDVQDRYVNVAFKYPHFTLAESEEVNELDKPLSKLMQSVIMKRVNSQNEESAVIEGTYQEVSAQCQMLERFQFNPKKLGLLLKMNADTLKNNNIFFETKRKANGYHLRIWYDPEHSDEAAATSTETTEDEYLY